MKTNMKKFSKQKIVLTGFSLLILVGAMLIVPSSHAATNAQDPFSSLIQKIASKFGLKEADVKAVFDQEKTDRMARMDAKETARLDELVKDGKITNGQKQLIIGKRNELKTQRQSDFDAFKNMTPTERKSAMDKERQAINDWAQANGIDPKYLMIGGHGMRGHGMGRPMGMK